MKAIKSYLKPFITGVIVTLLMVVIMLKVTIDFRYVLFIGTFLFFITGYFNRNIQLFFPVKVFLIVVSFSVLFVLMVLEEIPELYYFIIIFIVACALGLLLDRHKRKIVFLSAFLLVSIVYLVVQVIPTTIEDSLTQNIKKPLPVFDIKKMDGTTISSNSLKGQVIVLDFFGTWCAPCRKELKELDKVQNQLKDQTNVHFFVINADIGGDSPEKFKKFIEEHNYQFLFGYDTNSEIYKLLELQQSGVPVLLVVDKNQNIVLKHVGFNTSETQFADNLLKTLKHLMQE